MRNISIIAKTQNTRHIRQGYSEVIEECEPMVEDMRVTSSYYDRLKKLEEFVPDRKRKKQEEEIKQEMLAKKSKQEQERAERVKMEPEGAENEIKEKVVEDYTRKQAEKEIKAEKEKEKERADELVEERVKSKILAARYTEEDVNRILKNEQHKYFDTTKTMFVKVHRKYLLPDTLDAHHLPWEWDEVKPKETLDTCKTALLTLANQRDGNYIIIKRWINKEGQDDLFEHTRKLKERKLIGYEAPRKQDKLFIVGKKGSRRS